MADAGEGNSLSKELSDLRRLALDIKSLLSSQRETLSRAGLSMPPGVSEGLTQLAASLERIGRAVHEQEQERLQLRVSELDIEVHEDAFQYWRKYDRAKKKR